MKRVLTTLLVLGSFGLAGFGTWEMLSLKARLATAESKTNAAAKNSDVVGLQAEIATLRNRLAASEKKAAEAPKPTTTSVPKVDDQPRKHKVQAGDDLGKLAKADGICTNGSPAYTVAWRHENRPAVAANVAAKRDPYMIFPKKTTALPSLDMVATIKFQFCTEVPMLD